MPARIAVFASGGGTNLQALIDHFHTRGDAAARVVLLVASRPEIGALARAAAAGIAAVAAPPAASLPALLAEHRVELIVLAGYLQLVPPEVIALYRQRILNIHPALLPAFGGKGMYGIRVHRAVLESGARVSGATVHLVDEEYDRGRVLAQWPVPVLAGDTPESLAARVLRVEHLLLPLAVEALLGTSAARLAEPAAFDLRAAERPSEDSVRALGPAPW